MAKRNAASDTHVGARGGAQNGSWYGTLTGQRMHIPFVVVGLLCNLVCCVTWSARTAEQAKCVT